jgi:RNA polymerase sigma factor (sigma-70 family)
MGAHSENDSNAREADEPRPAPALVALLVDNHREFLSFLERRVGSRAEAEDILQEAFVRGLDKLDDVRDDERVVAWFYRMLRNAVIDRARRHGTKVKQLDQLAAELATEPRWDGDIREETHAQVCGCVSKLAQTLKPEYRTALQRIDIDGMPVKDFAVEAGISSGNAGVRVFRAREALRKQVARACGTCAEHGCFDCTCGSPAARVHGPA